MIEFVQGDVFAVELGRKKYSLIYADPPYANCRFRYARQNGSRQWGRNARGDFIRELIALMESCRQPDGVCALSMSSPELRLLHLFPSHIRVMAWVKPYTPMRPHVWPCYAWEPLIVWGKLPGRKEQLESETPRDWINVSPAVPDGNGHETPKPWKFAAWVIDVTVGPRRGAVLELFAGTAPIAREA